GMLLLELNRVLRPGGFFIWSATPVYRHKGDDEEIWSGASGDSSNIDWSTVRNVMDMNAHYGGFAAELAVSKKPLWVLNVVPTSGPDSLPIVFERGLVGIYHDWCESFNSYPRSYDLLHADHTVSQEVGRCDITSVLLEMDRLLRPEGWAVFRDHTRMGGSILNIATSFHWKLKFNKTEGGEVLLAFQKGFWRPKESEEEA
ncbi:unnamed protein product, partial [Closterium sp. NIES-54]